MDHISCPFVVDALTGEGAFAEVKVGAEDASKVELEEEKEVLDPTTGRRRTVKADPKLAEEADPAGTEGRRTPKGVNAWAPHIGTPEKLAYIKTSKVPTSSNNSKNGVYRI